MRMALLIPDGVGVRNFVHSGFLRRLPPDVHADVFHQIPNGILPNITTGLHHQTGWQRMSPYHPTRYVLTLQYSLGYAQMYWAKTIAMLRLLDRPVPGGWKLQALHRMSKFIGRVCGTPKRMRWLESVHMSAVNKLPEVSYYEREFKESRPDVLFCSNQRPSIVLPAILAARRLGIPTATFIFSWDNITSKGRIISPFDHYFVWGSHMAAELRKYYPDIAEDRIHIVGTPQFEPYADASLLWSREEFFRRIGADPERPLICYSGGDQGTCPEDQEHARVLMELIRDGKITGNAKGKPQVIVRPVPVDDGKRYERVKALFPELIYAQPEWFFGEPGDWSQVVPLAEDIRFLANLTHHADLNVNLGSTMTLDFGLHDKPVVNVAFDVADPPIFGMPVWDFYYFFEHYRPVWELEAARPARSPEQLASFINRYLEDPSLDREGRRRLAQMQVGVPLDQANARITETLRGIAKSTPRTRTAAA